MKILLVLVGLLSAPLARAEFDPPSMIEVGGGAAALGNGGIEALFRVNAVGATPTGGQSHFIWARISADFAGTENGISYIDMQFETLGFQYGTREANWAWSAVQLDLQRNLAIGNAMQLKVALIGLRGEIGGEVAPELEMYLKAAIDLIAVGYSRRASDGAESVGWGQGLSLELGFKMYDRVRIAIGEKLNMNLAKPFQSGTRTTCDDWGCDSRPIIDYQDSRFTSNTYLSVIGDITRNFSAFAQAGINVYVVNDSTGETVNSSQAGFQLLFGIAGRY
jgi:hypothetical protein